MKFAGEFTRGVVADCMQLRVFLPAIAGILACSCGSYCLRLKVFLPAIANVFTCKFHVFLPAKAGNFAYHWRANLHEFRM